MTDTILVPGSQKPQRRVKAEPRPEAVFTKTVRGRPRIVAEAVERCLQELVRYYRFSALGRRTSGIVHQMNGPLQVLSFHLELLEQKSQEELKYLPECPLPAAEKLERLRNYRQEKILQLRQELENLQIQARRLLYEGAQEEGQEAMYLDLNQLFLHELELYLAHPFFKHQVKKNFSFDESLPPIYGYYIDFSQSFRNLVDNALEAMAGGQRRELTIRTSLQAGWRLLCIGDTGVGIPPEVLPRIFDPFFTTKGTREEPRAGLGLFMARRLLARYGAQIGVKSQPGETWITVRLPVKSHGSESKD